MKSFRPLILRDPAVTEVATGTPSTSAPEKKVIHKQLKVELAKPVPDAIKKMTFDVNDFDTEQLPSTPPVQVENTKTGEVTPAKETSTTPELNTDGTIKDDKRERNPDGTFKEVVKVAEPKTKAAEAKVEPVPILKPPVAKVGEPAVKGKEVVKTIGLPTANQRDYTGYSAEEVSAFKQMSNEAFALSSRVIKENRELKKLEGSTYLQHEHAYVLDPEFQQANVKIQRVKSEAEHWRQQLVLAESGKPIKPIKGWDNRTGQMVLGDDIVPNAGLVEDIRAQFVGCQTITGQLNQQLEGFPQKYTSRIKEDTQAVEHEIKTRFAWEADPKLMDHTLSVEFEDGPRDLSLKQIKEDFTGLFPTYLRQSLGVRVAANMMIALKIQDAQLKQLQAGAQVQQTLTEERRLGEPTSEVRPATQASGKAVNGVTEFGGDPV